MPLWRVALRISLGLFFTVGAFLGGLISGDPLPMVLFVTLGTAFLTGVVHLACGLIVQAMAKHPPTPN